MDFFSSIKQAAAAVPLHPPRRQCSNEQLVMVRSPPATTKCLTHSTTRSTFDMMTGTPSTTSSCGDSSEEDDNDNVAATRQTTATTTTTTKKMETKTHCNTTALPIYDPKFSPFDDETEEAEEEDAEEADELLIAPPAEADEYEVSLSSFRSSTSSSRQQQQQVLASATDDTPTATTGQSCSSTAPGAASPQEEQEDLKKKKKTTCRATTGEQIFAQCKAESQHVQQRRASLDQATIPNSITAVVSTAATSATHSYCSFASPNTTRSRSSPALRRASDFSSRAGLEHRIKDLAILTEDSCFGGGCDENGSISSLEVSLGDDYLDHDSSSSSDDDDNDDGKMAFQRFKAAANYVVRGDKSSLMMGVGVSSSSFHPQLSEGAVVGGGRVPSASRKIYRRSGSCPIDLVDNIPIRPASSHEVERESRWRADHSSHGGSSAASTFQGGGDEQPDGASQQRSCRRRRFSNASSSRTSVLSGLQRVVDLQNLLPPVNSHHRKTSTSSRRSSLTNVSASQPLRQPQKPVPLRRTLSKTQRRAYSTNDLLLCETDNEEEEEPPRMPQRSSGRRQQQQRRGSRQSRWSAGSEEGSTTPSVSTPQQQPRSKVLTKTKKLSSSGIICDVSHRVPIVVPITQPPQKEQQQQQRTNKKHHPHSISVGNWIRYGRHQQQGI